MAMEFSGWFQGAYGSTLKPSIFYLLTQIYILEK
jgi:hypothetical protein